MNKSWFVSMQMRIKELMVGYPSISKAVIVFLGGSLLLGTFIWKTGNQRSVEGEQEKTALVSKWLTGPSEMESKDVLYLINKDKRLQEAFGGYVVQKLLVNEEKAPLAYIEPSFKLLQPHCPYYKRFSETTFLIVNHQYEQALKQAEALQKELGSNEGASYLYVLNLYRTALLYKKLGRVSEEKKKWKELELCMSQLNAPLALQSASHALMQALSYEDLTLRSYLQVQSKE